MKVHRKGERVKKAPSVVFADLEGWSTLISVHLDQTEQQLIPL